MQILNRYIGRTVLIYVLLVWAVLVALYTFFAFIEELDTLGRGDYDLWHIVQYTVLTIPRHLYEMIVPAALLGSLWGLGELAHHHELVVMRAAGIGLKQLIWAVFRVGIPFVMLALVLGEWIAPVAEQRAQELRSLALTQQIAMRTLYGFWALDGNMFINIRQYLPNGGLGHIFIYELDAEHRLKVSGYAESATYINDRWRLQNITESYLEPEQITVVATPYNDWESKLSPDLLSVVIIKPENLSISGLYEYIRYLQSNGLDTNRYQLAFWHKIITPFSTLVMLLVAIPFVLGPLRSVSIGTRIMTGTLIGLGFHLFNQIVIQVGQVNHYNAWLSAWLPTLLVLGLSLWAIRRI